MTAGGVAGTNTIPPGGGAGGGGAQLIGGEGGGGGGVTLIGGTGTVGTFITRVPPTFGSVVGETEGTAADGAVSPSRKTPANWLGSGVPGEDSESVDIGAFLVISDAVPGRPGENDAI